MKPLLRVMALWLLWSAGPGWEPTLPAQPAPVSAGPVARPSTNDVPAPPFPVYRPPTEIFRDLLKLTPAQLDLRLTNQRPQLRQQLEAKIHEYQTMPAAAREARLHATELHEYLQYFIKDQLPNRAQQLKSVPDDYRQEVSDRLTQFEILPPGLREEVLSQASTADYFVGPPLPPSPAQHTQPPLPQPPMPADPIKALSQLPDAERAQLFASFEDFFELEPKDQQKVIAAIPADQRGLVMNVLLQIRNLPRDQRQQSLQVIRTVAGMTDQQRQLFFSSAERWKAMSESERSTWLRLVSHLPPPPLPPPMPPLPPGAHPAASLQPVSVATNPQN
jgi:hypothetical protein